MVRSSNSIVINPLCFSLQKGNLPESYSISHQC